MCLSLRWNTSIALCAFHLWQMRICCSRFDITQTSKQMSFTNSWIRHNMSSDKVFRYNRKFNYDTHYVKIFYSVFIGSHQDYCHRSKLKSALIWSTFISRDSTLNKIHRAYNVEDSRSQMCEIIPNPTNSLLLISYIIFECWKI